MRDYQTSTAYFARPVTYYPYQLKNDAILQAVRRHHKFPRDTEIIDPNNRILETVYQGLKKAGNPDAFELFKMAAKSADIFILTCFADKAIGAGVYKEAQAYVNSKSPDDVHLFVVGTVDGLFVVNYTQDFNDIPGSAVLSVEGTRARIKDMVV